MKTISLLVYEDAVLSALSGTLDILSGANKFLQDLGKPPAFQIQLVSEKKHNIQLHQPAQFICEITLLEAANTDTDLIIAPAFNGNAAEVLQQNSALVDWIRKMRGKGTEVASLCFGSFFLAEAGVLDGKPCTSHWQAVEEMKQRYPEVNLLPDMVVTDQDGVYTSGGAFSSLNLILYLVEKFCGREVGVAISKMFSIDIDRVSQAHFAVFHGQRGHEDEEILEAQNFIETNYNNAISVEQVAKESHMSKRTFIRRFKKATQNTPMQYVQRVKVEAAKKALERGTQNISALIYDVGYNDVKSFRTVFKRITGLNPQDYRSKYSRAR